MSRNSVLFRVVAPVCLVGFLLGSCSAGVPQTGHRYALVYGVSKYLTNVAPRTNPNLECPDADAKSMADMFIADGYDEVISRVVDVDGNFILSGASGVAADAPTKANLEADLDSLAAIMGPNDLFVFYYSGHGSQVIGSDSNLHEWIDLYLTLVPNGVADFTVNWNAAVYEDELAVMLSTLPTARKVIILDSCYSGGFIGGGLETDRTPPEIYDPHTGLARPELWIISPAVISQAVADYFSFQSTPQHGISPYGNALVLSASGEAEFSWEDPADLKHGVMTYYLLGARAHGDLNKDGAVSVMEAFSLVKAGIDVNWNASLDPYYNFEPHISGGPVDFVLF
jgi:hypothetical protein